jgi:hypothetical protein
LLLGLCRLDLDERVIYMDQFFTWELLATFVGAATGTGIVTQFVKDVPLLKKLPTQFLSYLIALLILTAATAATGGATDWTGWAIIPLNAVLVSFSANGAYDALTKKTSEQTEE